MPQMRTIDQAAILMRERDPDTALTKTALRRLVVTGQLPHVRIGQKYLVSLEVLEEFLQGDVTGMPVESMGKIRQIS